MLVTLFNQKRYAEMEALARKMTVRFSNHGVVWKAMGTALLQQGRSEEALAPLQRAAELSPKDAQPYNSLGNTLLKLNRLPEAETNLRRALELKPDFVGAHNNLGNTLQAQGKMLEAVACFRRALQLDPNGSEAVARLTNALLKLEEIENLGQILEFGGGIKIAVPASLQLITPYVLREQQDWFEDEIAFVRKLAYAGMKALDIGANYGVYTLSLAALIGGEGHVWAFEPASSTADFLANSIALNNFENVTLTQAALSDHCGTARLSLNQNTELNSLSSGANSEKKSEEVRLLSLDQCMAEYGWHEIALIKLDAEGEESRIVDGGAEFLQRESPLIMFELKHGGAVNLPLIHKFEELGYNSYRLVPGLDLLVSFSAGEQPDGYQLNLFGCKADRANKLEQAGKLARLNEAEKTQAAKVADWQKNTWQAAYAQEWLPVWIERSKGGTTPEQAQHEKALGLFFTAHDTSLPAVDRYFALQQAYDTLSVLCQRAPSTARLSSLVRTASELGMRTIAIAAIAQALTMQKNGKTDTEEPLLPACPRFDCVNPLGRAEDWMLASLLEQMEKLRTFSSYYTGAASLKNLCLLRSTGFLSEEMNRRYCLIHERFGV